jgi:glycosyltransferase involved in cell wall biosynthesis
VPKRVLHLVHTPRLSGAETLVRELVIRQSGHLISAIGSFNPPEPSFQAQIPQLGEVGVTTYFPNVPLRRWKRVKYFKLIYEDFHPDVIFGHSVLPALYGRMALAVFGARPGFISVLHSATNDDYADVWLRLSEVLLARRADRVVAVSGASASRYRKRIPHGRKVDVISNGIDLSKFRAATVDRWQHREALGIAPGDRMILQVGRLCPVKQQLRTFDSLSPVIQRQTNLHLWFVGLTEDADYAEELQAKINGAELSQRVRLLGSRDDVAVLLASSDLYMMPSRFEAQSIAMLEALASGVAVVASDIPAFQFAREYEGVSLFDSLAKIDPNEIYEILQQARRYERNLRRFDIAITSQSYADIVELCAHD